ncbi:MAG: lysophospholipid acyltransferase family protein [Pirellulaceae bacterium]
MKRNWFVDWLVYMVVRVLICLIQSVRMETCHSAARVLAFLASSVLRVRGSVIAGNLATAFPELTLPQRRRLSRAMWEHLILMVCEIAHAPRKIHRRNWHQFVHIERKRELVRYLLDPRPMVMVSAHLGNFEIGGYVTGLLGFPSYTVARKLDNPYLDRFVNRFRSANGQFILPKQGSAAEIDALLQGQGLLMALGDQHAGPKGCWVDFFGKPASYHKAIGLFPLMHGAPLLLTYAIRSGRPLHFEMGLVGAADPREPSQQLGGVEPLTRWYNAALEALIRRTPDQYWWLHRRWKGEPPRRRRAAAA